MGGGLAFASLREKQSSPVERFPTISDPETPLPPDRDRPNSSVLRCERCRRWMRLVFVDYEAPNESVDVRMAAFPILQCPECRDYRLTPRGRSFLQWLAEQARVKGSSAVQVSRKTQPKRFDSFCKDLDFLYDSTDYEYIPGLWRREGDGFLTPVFFRPDVLLKYGLNDEYSVIFASDTYGSLYKKGSDGHYEHMIAFGVNQSGKVVMWLGDVDELPVEEQYYLRAFNVPSDHDVGSEFFQGQIEVIFTEPSVEAAMLKYRKSFLEVVLLLRDLKLTRLDKESFEETRRVARPIAWTDNLVGAVIQALHKICIESLDASALRKALRNVETGPDLDQQGSLKLMEMWLAEVEGLADASRVMSPFYVLNDLRILFAHLLPTPKAQELHSTCRSRLGVDAPGWQVVYLKLMECLAQSYRDLTEAISEGSGC